MPQMRRRKMIAVRKLRTPRRKNRRRVTHTRQGQ
jgi:hypothetical protein